MKVRELMPNENGSNRLDRIEHALDLLIDDHVQFRDEHKQLLTSQVLLTDRLDKLAQIVSEEHKATADRFKEIGERFKETDEKLNALIKIVDGMIRNPPRPNV